jgi:SNF family Na+-dependent transporter
MTLYDLLHDVLHLIFDKMPSFAVALFLLLVWVATVSAVLLTYWVIQQIGRHRNGRK